MGRGTLPFVVGDRWRAESLLARGGASRVYRAIDLVTGGEVALKLGEPSRTDSIMWDRFEREASALALIGSQHVVRVLAAGRSREPDAPFLVMERLRGRDLAREIKEAGPLGAAETLMWFEQAAVALELAHGIGIVHRDLKPSNLFLHEPEGGPRTLKVLDFGLVKEIDAAGTDPDAFAGTPAYMAPEQVRGHATRTGPATDVWAMGMVAIAMLTGGHYWPSESTEEILRLIRFEPMFPPSRRWPFLTPAFDEWFRRSCDRVAERRFPSVALQSQMLLRALAGAGPARAHSGIPLGEDRTAPFSRATTLAAAPPTREPAPLPTGVVLLGREAERRELLGILERRQGVLVTVTGGGGMGKTHLAQAVAETLQPAFPDGVWPVELGAVRDPTLLLPAIADAMGLSRDPVLAAGDQLQNVLADKRALIVLDGFEHLVGARGDVATLRERCPSLCVLVTSRTPLGLDGEERLDLAPLDVPTGPGVATVDEAAQYSGVQLFVARAKAASPGFTLTEENAAAVAELCRRLEGLPLAIELAAARVRSQQAASIQDGLAARLVGGHDAAMRATIAWSYDLLAEPERAAFRRLSVCAGGFDLSTAAAIIGDGTRGASAVTMLVDSSLLHRTADEPPRLAMFETVRGFAREALVGAGEEDAARRRALVHFAARAEEADRGLRGADQQRWIAQLAADHENLTAALTWGLSEEPEATLAMAARLSWFWYLRGHYQEGRHWLSSALERAPDATPSLRARALLGAGELAFLSCDYPAAEALLEESARLSGSLEDARGVAAAVQLLGSIARERGEYATATARHAKSRAAWGRLGDRREEARSLNYLSFVAWLGGENLGRAVSLAEAARAVFMEIGDREGTVWSSLNLGAAAFYQGDVPGAARRFEDAFHQAVGVRYQEGMAWSLNLQGLCSLAGREMTRARAQLRASLRLHRKLGDLWRSASVIEALSAVAKQDGHESRAAYLLGAARAMRRRIGVPVPAAERPLVAQLEALLGDSPAVARGERAPLEEALAAATEEGAV